MGLDNDIYRGVNNQMQHQQMHPDGTELQNQQPQGQGQQRQRRQRTNKQSKNAVDGQPQKEPKNLESVEKVTIEEALKALTLTPEGAGSALKTPVSVLQELLSRRGITPTYDLVQIEGAIHEPTFRYRVAFADKDGEYKIFKYRV